MSFRDNFPYSNFHELNLDWIIEYMQKGIDYVKSIKDNLKSTVDEVLTEHPEWVTTVPDGSITAQKLSDGVNQEIADIRNMTTDNGEAIESINARTRIPAQLSEEGCIALGNVLKSYYEKAHPASGTAQLIYTTQGWQNLFLESFKDGGVNAIQCSGFTGAAINAIPYENSRYNGWPNNIHLPFGYIWDDTARATVEYPEDPSGAHPGEINVASFNQKLYAQEHGFLWDATNLNIQPACGDIFFQKSSDTGLVNHCGVVLYASDIRAANAKIRVIEAWPSSGIRQKTYERAEIDFYARFPLGYSGGRNDVIYHSSSPLTGSVPSLVSVKILTSEELEKITSGDIVTARMRATVNYREGKSAQTGYNFSLRFEFSDDTDDTVFMQQCGEYYYCSYFTPANKTITAVRLMARGDDQITDYTCNDVRIELGLCPVPIV